MRPGLYVHESAQTRYRRRALRPLSATRNKNPARWRRPPSEKLFAFLAKNFSLTKYQPQTNNFQVFDAYFAVAPRPASAAKELRKLTQGRGVGLAAAARAKAAAARAAARRRRRRKRKRLSLATPLRPLTEPRECTVDRRAIPALETFDR